MNWIPQEIIRRKRDGHALSAAELEFMARGMTDGSVTEGQLAAFAMAVFFKGLTMPERIALTQAMTQSGTVLDWSALALPGPVLDKHSTGGVGDKVSLMLAPLVTACGAYVPMISGRGLGHTGGTLDKLNSIPGYDVAPERAVFQRIVKNVGCAIIGQTADLAPADRRFYAIRDVTATVESVSLITPSILSKKLAAGLQGLVMDVKIGSGAFMTEITAARELAESIVEVANSAGLPTTALITDMNQVLGDTAGNALEVAETVEYLTGARRNPRLHEVVLALGAEMLILGKLAAGVAEARAKLEAALESGAAAERFARMVAACGGPADFLERHRHYLPHAEIVQDVMPEHAGYVCAMDVRALGLAVLELGGGRRKTTDAIDYAVGLSAVCQLGAMVGPEQPLACVHARTKADAEAVAQAVRRAIVVGEGKIQPQPIIHQRLA